MIDFKVYWSDGFQYIASKVYHIDATKEKFLVTDYSGYFHLVDIENCELIQEDENND